MRRSKRVRAQPNAVAAKKSKSQIGFLDLGTDCLLYLCDGLDMPSLCAIAGTCKELQAIARKSFELRKINSIVCEPWPKKTSNVLVIEDTLLLNDLFRHFGHLLEEATIPSNLESLPRFVISCSGHLRKLTLHHYHYYTAGLGVDIKPMFKELAELSIYTLDDLPELPLHACKKLVSLRLTNRHTDKVLEDCMSTKFPQLKKFDLAQAVLPRPLIDAFLRVNTKLTHLIVHSRVAFHSFKGLKALECLKLSYTTASMRKAIGGMPLKSFSLTDCLDSNEISTFLDTSTTLRGTVQSMELVCSWPKTADISPIWNSLMRFQELRKLRLDLLLAFEPEHLTTGLERLIGGLPFIEDIELMSGEQNGETVNEAQRDVPSGVISTSELFHQRRMLRGYEASFRKRTDNN